MVASGRVSNKVARQVFDAALAGEGEPAAIVAARGWELVVDPAAIVAAVEAAFAAEARAVADASAAMARGDAGKIRSLSAFLAGKAIAASGGKAEPGLVRAAVDVRLQAAAGSLAAAGTPSQGASS